MLVDLSTLQIVMLIGLACLAQVDRLIYRVGLKAPLALGVLSGLLLGDIGLGLTTGLIGQLFYSIFDHIDSLSLPNYSIATIMLVAMIYIEPGMNGFISIFLLTLIAVFLIVLDIIFKAVNTFSQGNKYLGIITNLILLAIMMFLSLYNIKSLNNSLLKILNNNSLLVKVVINFIAILPLIALASVLGRKKESYYFFLSLAASLVIIIAYQINMTLAVIFSFLMLIASGALGLKRKYYFNEVKSDDENQAKI